MSAVAVSAAAFLFPGAVAGVLGSRRAFPTQHTLIIGPGGSGKSALLETLAQAWTALAPGRVIRGAAPRRPGRHDVRVVDDAHLLTAAALKHLADEAAAGQLLLVAARPIPDLDALDDLFARLAGGRVVDLGPWSVGDVTTWARRTPGHTPASWWAATGGLPWAGTASGAPSLTQRYRHLSSTLTKPELDVLHALAAGRDPAALGASPDTLDALEASGLVGPRVTLPPVVRTAALAELPRFQLRRLQRAVLDELTPATAPAILLALAESGVQDARLAAALEVAGDGVLVDDPGQAAALFAAAAGSGGQPGSLLARRAEAALRAGDLDEATRLVERLLLDRPLPDPTRSLPVALTLLARRGMADRAVELCRWHDAELGGSARYVAAFVCLLTGDRDAAQALVDRAPTTAPTLFDGAAAILHAGLAQSLEPDPTAAIATLVRGAESAVFATSAPVLPDCPAALAALAALHGGEVAVAASLLRREIERHACNEARLRLLHGWSLLMAGDLAGASAELAEAHAEGVSDTRDAFWAASLECALARRGDDPARLRASWAIARENLLRQPMDLLTLLPLGELHLVATRLHAEAEVAAPLHAAWALLERLGEPILWAAPLHWSGVQAAILGNRPPEIAPHARRLVAASGRYRYASVLAEAGRVWVRVLAEDADQASVLASAAALARVGQPWEGRRLLGHAASRCSDRRDSATYLDAARRLGVQEAASPRTEQGVVSLSPREVEVARLVLEGRTYREIGQTLYLSARTVEHHVARVKRRLGADTRAELLDQLRDLVRDQG